MFISSRPYFERTRRFLRRLINLAGALVLLTGTAAGAKDAAPLAPPLPVDYGEVVYRVNPQAPRQVYIIGQCHRSAVSDRVHSDTVKVQAEIYRIGEWLIREKNVSLLLPEGFFQRTAGKDGRRADEDRLPVELDNNTLEARLGDPRRFVNADLLLNASYDVRLGQVEDEQLYRDIRGLLRQAGESNSFSLLARLAVLQDERTAVMLQNIPDIVEESFQAGRIDHRRAMFTIGMAHLGKIIHSLRRGTLRSAVGDPTRKDGAATELKLLERGYGVTVIVPRTLAENEAVLRLARLENH